MMKLVSFLLDYDWGKALSTCAICLRVEQIIDIVMGLLSTVHEPSRSMLSSRFTFAGQTRYCVRTILMISLFPMHKVHDAMHESRENRSRMRATALCLRITFRSCWNTLNTLYQSLQSLHSQPSAALGFPV